MVEVLPPAKLTLSLRITGIRSDGYHLIDAEMVTLDFGDRLEIDEHGDGLEIIGDPITGASVVADGDNLVAKALDLVDRRAFVRLHKRIPAGAGLGGGSADAAAVLRWAGHRDPVSAASIGADVAFCLTGGRARVRGIGEIIEPLAFSPATFTLLTPPLSCSTPTVYRAWDQLGGPKGDNGNDLESAALVVVPELARARDELAHVSGTRPRLAGSGSTWFVPGSYPGGGRVVARTVGVPFTP